MHTKYSDGTDDVMPYDEAELKRRLADRRVRSVDIVKPGGVITRSNGKRYRLNERGQWERLNRPARR
jgi:hypothetical protein